MAEAATKTATLPVTEPMMADWDLTSTMAPYLDRHLVFALFDFLDTSTELFVTEDLMKAKFALLEETSMVDSSIDIHATLHPDEDTPKELLEKRDDVLKTWEKLMEESAEVRGLLELQEVQEMSGDGAQLRLYLEQNHGFKIEALEPLYEHAQLLFNIGKYADAGELLYKFSLLATDSDKAFSALWGRFASSILCLEWEKALADLNLLKDYIDHNSRGALEQLQQRTWLIHWSLFVFFNHPTGLDELIQLFLKDEKYANTIQTVCPHILRYLTTAVIAQAQNQKNKGIMKSLVKVIQQESYTYKDPITEFVECLYVRFDFDGAQQKLRECETVLMNDFFLRRCRGDFIENARLFVFETYCRIHNTISISMLAEKLNMDVVRAEEWIVNLIRHAQLDAKIDSKAGTVLMTPKVPSIYHQVIERTKSLTFRSSELADQHERANRPQGKRFG